MDVQSEYGEPATPAVSYNASWKTEDSGYHTSFTPGSVECSHVSNENLTQTHYNITPEAIFRMGRKYRDKSSPLTCIESPGNSPVKRRATKRPYQDVSDEVNSVPTPTTMIAGGIQKLKVTDNNSSHNSTISSVSSLYSDCPSNLYYLNEYHTLSFPTTPVKKICRSTCRLSPMKRSAKKLSFAIHSLSCSSNGLQPVQRQRPHSKVVRTIQFKPEQKVDIIEMLYDKKNAMPPLQTIFRYLSNEDVFNMKLVSPSWCRIWNQVSYVKVKTEYSIFLKEAKENQENKDKGLTPKNVDCGQMRSLKEVHNTLNARMVRDTPRSPPGTPRTNKFKKFTKSASLDSRLQMLCVRCGQPAKVTAEPSGEEWAACTSNTCSYQFCRSCTCERHPGKNCIRYDLDGPSPSKRRRNSCAVGSMKSRRNLRRLL